MQAPVAAIVVTYQSERFVAECLDSLVRCMDPENVVVVDNGSIDGTAELVARRYPRIHLIRQRNVGFAGGNNVGLEWSRRRGCRYAFMLNPDAVAGPDCIHVLTDFMDRHEDTAIASPKVHWSDGKTIWFGGAIIDWENGLTPHVGNGEADVGQFDRTARMERACGAAMMVRLSAVDRIGPMPEDYFLYFEEADWSRRFVDAGYSLYYVPAATCRHAPSSSTGEDSPLSWYYMTRNNLLFMSRHGKAHWRSFRKSLRRRSYRNAKNCLRRPNALNLRRVGAIVKGYADFALGRFGRGW